MDKRSGWNTEMSDISLILAFDFYHFMPKIKGVSKNKNKIGKYLKNFGPS